jgi:hypothetical protein
MTACRASGLLMVLLMAGCQPGFSVEVYNAGSEEVVLMAVGAEGERRQESVAPGSSSSLGGALAWYVGGPDGGWAVELPHPGEEYASRTLLGRFGTIYRFQVVDRCLIVLSPDRRPPVSRAGPQPAGYPVGPSGPCRISVPLFRGVSPETEMQAP